MRVTETLQLGKQEQKTDDTRVSKADLGERETLTRVVDDCTLPAIWICSICSDVQAHPDHTDCHTFWRKTRNAFSNEDETLSRYLQELGAYDVPVAKIEHV